MQGMREGIQIRRKGESDSTRKGSLQGFTQVEIDGGDNHTIRYLKNVPRKGDTIIDSLIGKAKVTEVVWLTDTDKVRIYVE